MTPGIAGATLRPVLAQLGEIQLELRARDLEGWLLYDYRGQNPIAQRALEVGGRTLTRRWFYWLPADGIPVLLVHATEIESFPASLPGDRVRYLGWSELRDALAQLVPTKGRVAMEYVPMGNHPDLSRVDAGTVELVRSGGATIVSSGDLVQLFMCRLDAEQLASHRRTAAALVRAKDAALAFVSERLRAGEKVDEIEVQMRLVAALATDGLAPAAPPHVAAGPSTASPHYLPHPAAVRTIEPGDLVLIDVGAREAASVSALVEVCWVAVAGAEVPARYGEPFASIVAARRRAIELIETRIAEGRRVLGFEVDRAARDEMARAGLADRFVHRTGHNLSHVVSSGDGCTFDDLEVHDTRELVVGLAWSIHPGVYFEDFGLRSGVSVYLGERGLELTTPAQDAITTLL